MAVEARRAAQKPHPDSMDLHFQGMAWLNKGLTAENMTQARAFFEHDLASDSDNVEALVGVAFVDYLRCATFSADNRDAVLAAAEANLLKALSLAPDCYFTNISPEQHICFSGPA